MQDLKNMKNELALHLCISENTRNFSKKALSKNDKRRVKKYPNLLNSSTFKISRSLKEGAKRRSKFCMSHKNGCAGILFGKGKFGLDIELLKPRDFEAVVQFCFSEGELKIYKSSKNKILAFYQIYTAKEAMLKAENLGFSELGSVDITKSAYTMKHFVVNDLFMVCIIFKGKKDIIKIFYE